ncbi:NADP-dependent phosphogluconate dehydrogenase [Christiangramia sp. SM2212]|uniref:6-phosphogluconate dehydrogenase, decarboxylating n=1 Tax=Christiangramia sediminicola TaxID=3073267 RepID=A0ABU1EP95_9FLAO|nr:NADP-dependent phosphogluconate dehydrogenase [Christiangramia sp. SM2212]MDR5590220.1 NADP-dependent phosphogluconate dehydrogenase [Christiangramia sp. SM2212]
MSRVYVLMGVSGVGKTTLGLMLAEKLSIPFYDADDFHSLSNKEKMQNGIPLNDLDREEWLGKLQSKIPKWQNSEGGVLACSALKEKYREQLAIEAKGDLEWVFLYEDFSIIADRIKKRKLHFFDPDLLKSQYDTLEPPDYGIHIKVENSPEESLKEIIAKISIPEIGIIGLGVMGKSLALNLAGKNISVSVYDPLEDESNKNIARKFINEHSNISNLQGFDELKTFVSNLSSPRKILMMIKAGEPIDGIIEKLIPLLDQGDLIMDGGNSHYKDTERRLKRLNELGIHFLGVGVSGGEEGALNGPSIMPGGSLYGYKMVRDILGEIAAKDLQGKACCNYIGPGSSGHFVKMVHNGIEYGEMQLIAEFYYFMRYFQNRTPHEISEIFTEWNQLEKSFLLEITAHILIKKEGEEYLLDKVLDIAGQKGTGGWTTIAALEEGVSLDTITASVFARNISVFKPQKKEIQKIYKVNSKDDQEISSDDLYKSFRSASIINHSTGMELLRKTSTEYGWNLNLSEIARIWTNGCIIRSTFMEDLADVLNPETNNHLLLNPSVALMLNERQETFNRVIPAILAYGCPMQASSSALNYFLSFTREFTSANLIQAQRDYFGAHTYQRTDKPEGEYFHSNWKPE